MGADLQAIIEAWSTLTEDDRRAVLAIVGATDSAGRIGPERSQ
jgi:hypothetical protein